MDEIPRQWGEKEWERYANSLLSIHYSLHRCSYQRIPDLEGDHGLEGLADDNAYQSYADQGSANKNERTQKQKAKIYKDLKKLDTFKDWWSDFLGIRKIRRWTLIVPIFHDKEVVKYARKRARELARKSLPFIHNDFEGFVKSADDFPQAKLIIREPVVVSAGGLPATPTEIAEYATQNPRFVQNIGKKLTKVLTDPSEERRLQKQNQFLQWHLEASNLLSDLQSDFPTLWEELNALLTTRGQSIETENFIDSPPSSQRLTGVRRQFEESLKSGCPYLAEKERVVVSWGMVSRWLGECPLDFPEKENA